MKRISIVGFFLMFTWTAPILAETHTSTLIKDIDEALRLAAIKTDFYFCVQMSEGKQLTSSADKILWTGMGCDKIVETAKSSGITDAQLGEIALQAIVDVQKEPKFDFSEEAGFRKR